MGKRLLIFAIIFLSLLAFTIWRAQPPFRLHRKLLAKLPYAPDNLLVTDLDDDGHPEVMALTTANMPPIWVRFPFDKPSLLRFENCQSIRVWGLSYSSVLKALPVLTADNRLRLLRYRDGKATLDPLPIFPDVPVDEAQVYEGRGTGTVFLGVYQGKNVWLFTLAPKGEWQFVSQFTTGWLDRIFGFWLHIYDLADLDRDSLLDALCVQKGDSGEKVVVFWGGRKEKETDLGIWMQYECPQVADLDGDGWKEIVVVAKDRQLKIWRFDRMERRLKVIATSPPLPINLGDFTLHLFDLDGDGQKEIFVVADFGGDCWVFQWRDGKLKMWQGKMKVQVVRGRVRQLRLGDQLALFGGYQYRPVWLFPPRLWIDGGRVEGQFLEEVGFTVFCLLPKDEQAFSPPHWHFQEAPFELWFAGDIDGDGSDEVIGYDGRWRCWRLYRAEVTKAGELRWRDVLLGGDEPKAFAMLVDGERRGLVVAWEDGRLELLTMESRR
jgi:hypothetical protein